MLPSSLCTARPGGDEIRIAAGPPGRAPPCACPTAPARCQCATARANSRPARPGAPRSRHPHATPRAGPRTRAAQAMRPRPGRRGRASVRLPQPQRREGPDWRTRAAARGRPRGAARAAPPAPCRLAPQNGPPPLLAASSHAPLPPQTSRHHRLFPDGARTKTES